MKDQHIERWARLLVGYCVDLKRDETALITGELTARPLIAAVYREALRAGGHPRTNVVLPELTDMFLAEADRAQLSHVSPIAVFEAKQCDARAVILSETNTRAASGVDPARQALRAVAMKPVREIALKKKWALTLFPTNAYAQEADMGLADYEQFVARAMFLDKRNPKAAWQALGKRQAKLVRRLSKARDLHIVGPETDLRLSVAGRTWINSDGRHNMPSGEVFTGPVEASAEGTLHCSFPVCTGGRRIEGIRLRFHKGRVVEAAATKNEAYLKRMLDMDVGARRPGELGIGLNYGIQQFTGNILFDEKIGGSVHLALGRSYPETGGRNTSALHWDLIVDLRQGGQITADGKCVMRNGKWLVG